MSTELLPIEPARRVLAGEHAFVRIDSERCVGCQECVIRCPTNALRLDPANWIAQADDLLCVGCRQCQRVCPYLAIEVTGPVLVAPRQEMPVLRVEPLEGDTRELKRGFAGWREALLEADRCLLCPDPTCVEGCPAHNDIPGFIAALRERDLAGANATLRQTTVLPDVCSRVCDQSVQCEGACSWALAGGQAVSIGRLERFVTEWAGVPDVTPGPAEGAGLSIAVVGSGPAGCAAAWELLSARASVTMIEKDEEPGGVLRWGIPDFTLPAAIARRPIDALLDAGLDLRTGCALGRDVRLDELLDRHDAVILAYGASKPLMLPIPGVNLPGVEEATGFLKRAKLALAAGHRLPEIGSGAPVLVIGGGNTAMDVARTVRRLGGLVVAVEWMDERFTRVRPDELAEARQEGVDVRFTTTVERLEGDGVGVSTAWLRRTRQRRLEELPRVVRGEPERLAVDRVVFALGYRVEANIAAEVGTLPLPRIDLRHAFPNLPWTASGLLAGEANTLGLQALEREVTLAVAAAPALTGWWARLVGRGQGRKQPRTGRWARIWRRQAAIGLAAASMPYEGRVWVVGDALVGPSTVVGAMAQGREAARSILRARPHPRPAPRGALLTGPTLGAGDPGTPA
jgi:glutamate synthase (NADPH) small chain